MPFGWIENNENFFDLHKSFISGRAQLLKKQTD